MATYQQIDLPEPFAWGGCVRLIGSAQVKFPSFGDGSICGARIVDSERVAKEFSRPVGTLLLLVESGAGTTIEVPIDELLPLDANE